MNKIWITLTIIVLISLHLKVASVGDFQVSLGFILIPFWLYRSFKIKQLKFYRNEELLFLFFLILPFLPLNIIDWTEFFKTYGQYAISCFVVIRTYKKPPLINKPVVEKALYNFQIIILACVLIQYVFVNIMGIKSLYNIFGSNQLYYQLDSVTGKGRMKAFYLEPSYLGFIALNVFWTRFYLFEKQKWLSLNLLFTVIILAFTNSAFAYIGLFLVILFEIFSKQSSKIFFTYGFFAILVLTIIIFIFRDQLFTLFRLDELSTTQSDDRTSGFMRVTLPLQVLGEIWKNQYYFGLTFGQLDVVAKKIFSNFGETSISNSFFLILGYFGILGALLYAYIIRLFFTYKNRIIKSFIILSFINLNNSGAFMTIQYAFVAFLIPFLAIKLNEEYKNINNNSSSK